MPRLERAPCQNDRRRKRFRDEKMGYRRWIRAGTEKLGHQAEQHRQQLRKKTKFFEKNKTKQN